MKAQGGTFYKHSIPEIQLSLERGTSRVPQDGKFYIVKAGKVLEGFRVRKLAEEKFKQLVAESGFTPPTTDASTDIAAAETVYRYVNAKIIFYAEGPKYRRRSGRGGRGGV